MKTNNWLLLFALAIAGCLTPDSPEKAVEPYDFTADSLAVLAVLSGQVNDWNAGDLDGFMKGYWKNDSLSFIGGRGITKGWQATLDSYKRGYPDTLAMGKLSFDILEMHSLASDWINVVGRFSLKRAEDNPFGHFSLLFRKVDENWLIFSDITAVPPSS